MVSASFAKTTADTARTNLTYVNALISGDSQNGHYSIIQDETFIYSTAVGILTGTYGYRVTLLNSTIGTYKRYVINWE